MNANEQIAIIDGLSEDEQDWLGLICTNLGDKVPDRVAKVLLRHKLIVKLKFPHDGYDVSSYWTHYCWCMWCARKEMANANNRPNQDQERP